MALGAFAVVRKVVHKETGEIFAVKIVEKKKALPHANKGKRTKSIMVDDTPRLSRPPWAASMYFLLALGRSQNPETAQAPQRHRRT